MFQLLMYYSAAILIAIWFIFVKVIEREERTGQRGPERPGGDCGTWIIFLYSSDVYVQL